MGKCKACLHVCTQDTATSDCPHNRCAIGGSLINLTAPIQSQTLTVGEAGSKLSACSPSAPAPTDIADLGCFLLRACSICCSSAQKLLAALANNVAPALHVGGARQDLLLADGYLGSEELDLGQVGCKLA